MKNACLCVLTMIELINVYEQDADVHC